MPNHLLLAVAGSRKTQGIVDYCAGLSNERRVAVLTFTLSNQAEIRARLRLAAPDHPGIVVMGWYTFLLRDFARPFLPFKFANARVQGFNFDGAPYRYATGIRRFLDSTGSVYARELARLAHELMSDSKNSLVRRLECIYDEILIDEVQDLSAHDWEIVEKLLVSRVVVRMVGDIRQAVLSTNPRSRKNKKYAYADALLWFRKQESQGLLTIEEQSATWRCHPKVAAFSDSIFDPTLGFPTTRSMNARETGHDGVFLVAEEDVDTYVQRFSPRCLRDSKNSGKKFDLDYCNFKVAKGQTFERVLIVPTEPILRFLKTGAFLAPSSAAKFYVGVTRAAQSVAIVVNGTLSCGIPYWRPQ